MKKNFKIVVCDDFCNQVKSIKCKSENDFTNTLDKLDLENKKYMGYINNRLYVKHKDL